MRKLERAAARLESFAGEVCDAQFRAMEKMATATGEGKAERAAAHEAEADAMFARGERVAGILADIQGRILAATIEFYRLATADRPAAAARAA